jgi:hypothetical protein
MSSAQKAAKRVELMRWVVARYDGPKKRVERERRASLQADFRDARAGGNQGVLRLALGPLRDYGSERCAWSGLHRAPSGSLWSGGHR